MNNRLKGCILIMASMLLWSLIGPFVRIIALPSYITLFFTSFFGFLFLFIYILKEKRKIRELLKERASLLMYSSGLFVGLNLLFYYKAYASTTFANSVLTHYTAPVFAALLAPVFLKEKLERITIISLIISFFGLYLITYNNLSFSSLHLAGIIYGLLSGLFYGIAIVVNKKLTTAVDSKVIIAYQGLVTSLMMMPFLFFVPFKLTAVKLSLLIAYALLLFVGAAIIYLIGLKYVKAQHSGIISYVEPIAAISIGFLFFNETPTIKTLIGGLFILLGGYLILRGGADKE